MTLARDLFTTRLSPADGYGRGQEDAKWLNWSAKLLGLGMAGGLYAMQR